MEKAKGICFEEAKRLGRLLRTGILYSSTLLAVSTIAMVTLENRTEYPIKLQMVGQRPTVELHTTRELFLADSEAVARESYAATGHYNLKKLRRIANEYFRFLEYTKAPLDRFLEPVMPAIAEASKPNGLKPELVAGVIMKESAVYPYAVGAPPYYALGYMQINPKAHRLSKNQYEHIFEEKTNFGMGSHILKDCLRSSNSDISSALREYYGGKKNSKGTKSYVANVRDHMNAVRHHYSK